MNIHSLVAWSQADVVDDYVGRTILHYIESFVIFPFTVIPSLYQDEWLVSF
ncbi:hypothetical protein MKY42_06030 [Paenibacillus sp. FSL W7-1088]|uniref:hypothetical protein n=1 Tax=Paenibacillus sp. FSL W7-1088 TaxID=2921695 RepID=UPI0030EC4BEA